MNINTDLTKLESTINSMSTMQRQMQLSIEDFSTTISSDSNELCDDYEEITKIKKIYTDYYEAYSNAQGNITDLLNVMTEYLEYLEKIKNGGNNNR